MKKDTQKVLTYLQWRLAEIAEDLSTLEQEREEVRSQINEIERQTSMREEPEWGE